MKDVGMTAQNRDNRGVSKEATPVQKELSEPISQSKSEVKIQEIEEIARKSSVSEKDFVPLQKLGRGSFGDVYLIRDRFPGSGKLYAMKILNKRPKMEESWLRYVTTERDVLAYSDNPFIIKLHYAF